MYKIASQLPLVMKWRDFFPLSFSNESTSNTKIIEGHFYHWFIVIFFFFTLKQITSDSIEIWIGQIPINMFDMLGFISCSKSANSRVFLIKKWTKRVESEKQKWISISECICISLFLHLLLYTLTQANTNTKTVSMQINQSNRFRSSLFLLLFEIGFGSFSMQCLYFLYFIQKHIKNQHTIRRLFMIDDCLLMYSYTL